MINLTHYIKAKSVADTYISHKRDLNKTAKKQHFFVRLSLCPGYDHFIKDMRNKNGLFDFIKEDLTRKLSMSWDELWKESMDNNKMEYKKKIAKTDDENIKFYFGMTEILDEACILLRNGMDLPDGIEKRINRRFILKMIDIANSDSTIKVDEATTYVNGIGCVICLKKIKNSLIPIDWKIINDCYDKIFEYYIQMCSEDGWLDKASEHTLHNRIYGLTHCIINLSNYYTERIDTRSFNEKPDIAARILNNIIDSQKSSNYKLFNDDALAEMLLCIKLCGGENWSERLVALDSLSGRFDSEKLMFREHKYDSFKDEILQNEHTNILYILNVLL